MLGAFGAALASSAARLPGPGLLPERLASACVQVLPVAGAEVSVSSAGARWLPLGASGEAAGAAERLQFTAGEGPRSAAQAEQCPVVADEVQLCARWPTFTAELIAGTPFRGVIALPLGNGWRQVGVLDLYVAPPGQVGDLSLVDALVVAEEVTRVLQAANEGSAGQLDGPAWLDAPPAARRALVWQALGYLNVTLAVDSTDALALLRGFAYSHAIDVDTVAAQVVEGSLPVAQLSPGADTS